MRGARVSELTLSTFSLRVSRAAWRGELQDHYVTLGTLIRLEAERAQTSTHQSREQSRKPATGIRPRHGESLARRPGEEPMSRLRRFRMHAPRLAPTQPPGTTADIRTLLHSSADTGAATGESIAGAVAFNPAATIKRRIPYALAGLAVIAMVTVALAAAPGPAQAQSGSFCVGFDGVIVSPGELVRRFDRSDPRRVYESVYLCKDDGRLALLYSYCTGPDCWPYEQRNPRILAYDPGFGGGGGSTGCSRGEIPYWFAYAAETDVFCNA